VKAKSFHIGNKKATKRKKAMSSAVPDLAFRNDDQARHRASEEEDKEEEDKADQGIDNADDQGDYSYPISDHLCYFAQCNFLNIIVGNLLNTRRSLGWQKGK
jgi:hypothetical protein